MQTEEFGYPLDEIADYLFVEIHDEEDAIVAEVRAELSYEGMDKLARSLNPIVEKYDNDAYFDMVDPGIMEAYLMKDKIKKIQGSETITSAVDYDNPINIEKKYSVTFDTIVEVDENGDMQISESETFEAVYDDEYKVEVDDGDGFAEKLLDLVYYNIPEDPGEYRISGVAVLVYGLDNIYTDTYEYADSYDEGTSTGEEFIVDDVDIDYDEKSSQVENLQVEKID